MIPFGCETVTVLHRFGGGYAPYILRGCSWRSAKARSVYGTTVDKSDDTVCRIPAGQTMPDVGDVLILGAYNMRAESEIALVRLLDSLRSDGVRAIRVTQVRDNSRCAPIPHYAVTGA